MFQGHHGEVWSLAVSTSGNVVATAAHDKSIRLWQKTHEPLILEEEREMVESSRDFITLLAVYSAYLRLCFTKAILITLKSG